MVPNKSDAENFSKPSPVANHFDSEKADVVANAKQYHFVSLFL